MDILNDLKTSLRVTNTAFDIEIIDLIDSAKSDLRIAGVYNLDESDALIKRAITLYVKSHFGYDDDKKHKFDRSYEMLRNHLSMSFEYSFYKITFTVTDTDTTDAIQEAIINLENDELNYNESTTTDASGQAVFYVRTKANYKYDVTATDYDSDLHTESDKNIVDITSTTTVSVSLSGV